jgi:EAL domain-containing protein (putative c-di-GMP-specific phosphodiesterase class I)
MPKKPRPFSPTAVQIRNPSLDTAYKPPEDLSEKARRLELFLQYQPRIDLASGRILGAEALVRWRHPELEIISPEKFIPIAEDMGLIIPISEWVLKTACAQNRAWQKAGPPPIVVSVNLSPR